MPLSQRMQFEELDARSREYLLTARDQRGRGMPGVFVPKSNYLPAVGFFVGLVIIGVMFGIAWANMEDEPLAVAMLEAIGVLVGGWMVVAALRVWAAARSTKYVGHFVYADAETVWDCSGAWVNVIDVRELLQATGVQNFNQGKYQNTTVTLQFVNGNRQFAVAHAEQARILLHFLNVVAWMRGGGDGKPGEAEYKGLPPVLLGGAAKEHAVYGAMPRQMTAEALELDVQDVPTPSKEGRASGGLIWYPLIIAAGVGAVLGFRELNVTWRDDKVWGQIQELEDPDDRGPWLRVYLNDSRNTRHRDDARAMLRNLYRDNVERIRRGEVLVAPGGAVNPVPNFNPAGPNPGQPNRSKVDEAQLAGLAEVLDALVDLPQPIVSVSVREEPRVAGDVAAREKVVLETYTRQLLDGVGEKLIQFVQAPPETPGMIDITYAMERGAIAGKWQTTFAVKFRRSVDDEPVKVARANVLTDRDPVLNVAEPARQLGVRTAGEKKQKIQRVNVD